MDISKFDFTKFSEEKWADIIAFIEKDPFIYIDMTKLSTDYGVPMVEVYYSDEYSRDFNKDSHVLKFTAFDVNVNDESTKDKWRKIMINEFGEEYRNALVDYLQLQILRINNI